jgi:biopolymer transport protein ExbD
MTGTQPLPAPGKRKLHSVKIDMTPMVDLGFLLITFFIFTTSMAEPKITKLLMPKDGRETNVPQSKALTVLLDKNKVYVYAGQWKDAIASNAVVQTTYDVLQIDLGISSGKSKGN